MAWDEEYHWDAGEQRAAAREWAETWREDWEGEDGDEDEEEKDLEKDAMAEAWASCALESYLSCALWSSTGDDGGPLDREHSREDIDAESEGKAEREMAGFYRYVLDTVGEAAAAALAEDPDRGGHDFWLSRNGHGAGFFDGDWDPLGDALQAAAKTFGTSDAYVGDDGKVYLT